MIIKKIILENIRSYEKEEIEFNLGSTLLAGDIGSGKTSVLLAIEFGLFGLQPGQRGSSLLRNGTEKGGVKLEFDVEGKEIFIERTLKKGKTVSQDYCSITIDGQKEELSVTEIKQRVLELLDYPREFSKKQNILYKFTVYTPQEEMKQIILEDSETRVNTLRHVFGIDKYKSILENVSVLRLKLREEKRMMEGVTSNLLEEEQEILKKEKELNLMIENTFELKTNFLLKTENRKEKEKAKEILKEKIEEKNKLKQEVEKSKIMILSKKETSSNNQIRIKELESEIEKFKSLKFDELQLIEIEEAILKKKKEKEKESLIQLETNSEIISLRRKIEEAEKLHGKISELETCPTCYQNVDAIYRANVLNKAHNELSQGKIKTQELELKKRGSFEKIKNLELEISFKEKELTELKILKMKLEGINERIMTLEKLTKLNSELEKDLLLLGRHLSSLNDSLFELSRYDNLFLEKEEELKTAHREEKIAEIKLAELMREIEVYSKSIKELKIKLEKIKEIKKKLDNISELESWLNTKFIPVISFIEKNVMGSLKYEFSKLFSEWFSALVPENFDVRLGDDFSPIIEQKDYEIDYAYLSGGERTAIALAYRLALNQVINSLMSKIKTRDLVILDEPTDGFSEQQLDKMREVLEQLNVKQLIIVSHEQKIEGFVENVIKFRKEHGVSLKE